MKFFRGLFPGLAVLAALVCAAATANAQMSAPYDAGRTRPVSDVDSPYAVGPPPVEVPRPAPRYYGYGPDRGGYVPERRYAPDSRYESDRGYAPERGYGPDYGYAPAPELMPPHTFRWDWTPRRSMSFQSSSTCMKSIRPCNPHRVLRPRQQVADPL